MYACVCSAVPKKLTKVENNAWQKNKREGKMFQLLELHTSAENRPFFVPSDSLFVWIVVAASSSASVASLVRYGNLQCGKKIIRARSLARSLYVTLNYNMTYDKSYNAIIASPPQQQQQ